MPRAAKTLRVLPVHWVMHRKGGELVSRSDAVTSTRRRGARVTASSDLLLGNRGVLITTISGLLLVVGLLMILSASSVTSFANYGSSYTFFKKQLVWALAGIIAFAFFARLDYHKLRGWGYASYVGAVALLILTLVPGVGVTVGGGTRWISLGAFAFQPSEFAKLALVLLAADVFSRKREHTLSALSHTLIPMIPALGLLATLVMAQPDLGTTLLLGATGLGLLFVAGAPMRFLAPLGAACCAVAAFGALSAPYRRARVLAFLDPWADPLVSGYHTIQSLIALGSGGWFGVGLGASRQKWMYIPNAHTDFIFAILGEEMGLLGTIVVVGMFAFLCYLGITTARNAGDRFGMLVASGITIWISLQALINMGAVTASLPITGVPLPLVSFGGTSLVLSLAAMGVLTNIAYQGQRVVSPRTAAPARGRRAR
jgi:cell division protein FtsW